MKRTIANSLNHALTGGRYTAWSRTGHKFHIVSDRKSRRSLCGHRMQWISDAGPGALMRHCCAACKVAA